MSGSELVRALAPAKVNLRLEVLGEREDGYHEIRSWTLAVDLCDSLDVRASVSGGIRLSLSGPAASPDVPVDGSNLVSRAASASLDEGRRLGAIGPEAGVDIALLKRIPSRAGLGGGSSVMLCLQTPAQASKHCWQWLSGAPRWQFGDRASG